MGHRAWGLKGFTITILGCKENLARLEVKAKGQEGPQQTHRVIAEWFYGWLVGKGVPRMRSFFRVFAIFVGVFHHERFPVSVSDDKEPGILHRFSEQCMERISHISTLQSAKRVPTA